MAKIATWPLLLAGFAALSVSSCADNDTSLYVEAVMAPAAPACNFSADPSSLQLFSGTLDVGLSSSYRAVLLVANQLAPRGDKTQLRTETQGVELRGAEVVLTDAKGAVLDEFSTPTGGFVHANRGDAPGYGLTSVTLVPPGRGERFADTLNRGDRVSVVANVRVFGDTLGGIEVTSGDFRFVVSICKGCLISYPSEALQDEGGGAGPQCTAPLEDAPEETCGFGQDEDIDCRVCAALPICLSPFQ